MVLKGFGECKRDFAGAGKKLLLPELKKHGGAKTKIAIVGHEIIFLSSLESHGLL